MAKDYFKENNVAYETIDVSGSMEKKQELMDKSGQLGVPVILIDDKMIIGFNKPKIAAALGLAA